MTEFDWKVIASLVLAGASSITAVVTLINSLVNRRMIKLQGQMKEIAERDLKMREEAMRAEQAERMTKAVMWDLQQGK